MRTLKDRVAVVTGAAGGIGRALCERLAQIGCDLALVDVNESGLAETAARVNRSGRQASIHLTDVANRSQMERLPEAVLRRHHRAHVLVNNAGVSLAGPFESCTLDDWEWIVGINLWGVVYGCKFFLPVLQQEAEAHIVNIASDFGLIGLPTKSAYSATKFAVRGFSEALRAELCDAHIGVTCVYPGPVNTELIRDGRAWNDAKQKLEAEFVAARGIPVVKVAERIIGGIKHNAARVLIGKETIVIDLMSRLFPALTNSLVTGLRKRCPFL